MKILSNKIIRILLLGVMAWGAVIAALEPEPSWPFKWLYLTFDVCGILMMSFVPPSCSKKPIYRGTFLTGDFLPYDRTWPVWIFWGALCALVFHAVHTLRGLTELRMDYHFVRSLLIAVWLWVLASGKLPKWISTEASLHDR